MNKYATRLARTFKSNSSSICVGVGVSGVLVTSYFVGKASFIAAKDISEYEELNGKLTKKEKIKLVWKNYIPAATSGILTTTLIISGAKLESKKTATAYSLLSISEKAFIEYKDKVVEQIGSKKEQGLRDQIAQDRVTKTNTVIVSDTGNVLCYEMHTGRYFNSDIESIKKAQNTVNSQMIRSDEATLNDFYYLLGLPQTSYSGMTGWTSDKMLDITFSAVMAEDGRPCIAFEYNYIKSL